MDSDFYGTLGQPDIFPTGGFVHDYVEWCKKQTDAPPVYHLASGLALVSAWMGNSIWVESFGGRHFPATWNLLLGPSTYVHKSTCMNMAVRLVSAADDTKVKRIPGQRGIIAPVPGSREAFEAVMEARADGLMPLPEFASLLNLLKREYMAGAKELMTAWYDGDATAKFTKGDQLKVVKDPALTVLGASTMDWFEGEAKDGDLRGGFLARIMYWPATKQDKLPRKRWQDTVRDKTEEYRLITILQRMRAHKGMMYPSQDAYDAYDDWQAHLDLEDLGPSLASLQGRMQINAQRMAMTLQAASLEESTIISETWMRAAIRIADWLMAQVGQVVRNLAGTKERVEWRRVLEAIGTNGGAPRGDVLRKLGWDATRLNRIASAMEEAGDIEILTSVPTGGRPKTVFKRVDDGV